MSHSYASGKRPGAGPPNEGGFGGPPAKRQATASTVMDPVDEMDFIEDDPAAPPEPLEDVELGEAGRNWERPPVPEFDPNTTDLEFQQLEVDYYLTNASPGLDDLGNGTPHDPKRQVPVIRMYGVNAAGNSVCTFVHGFLPYFYVESRPNWGPEAIDAIASALTSELSGKAKGLGGPPVIRIEPCDGLTSVWNYQGTDGVRRFLKVVVAVPNLVAPARAA
ncbi:hypothetical protein GPECTOR_25g384 [Gonium pectorale]|uniref:DNA polymerase zeta catalytic subunit N-terminal domain-containing protein n=1 Tax=Gonium pectorale TaxID=33097 RepID=A0A150GHG4_GONPE|nr:hypothetical protein GPECTOR_25g384 [Gonium pectorale]|eukprot:KXZ48800.1 hypothetical protein GPECTOR_25g384 [Gonium pectorale]